MPPLSPPPRISRCSAPSRSFLPWPDGPAGAPPVHCLRLAATWRLGEAGQARSAQQSVHALRGTPHVVRARLAMCSAHAGGCLAAVRSDRIAVHRSSKWTMITRNYPAILKHKVWAFGEHSGVIAC